jgi:hypothetical protein
MTNTYVANAGPKISLWNGVSEELGFVRGVFNETGQGNRGNLLFGTRTSDALGAETKMTILHNGNVGIGTSSPGGNLEVYAATPTIICGATAAGSLHGIEFKQSNTLDAYIKQLPQTGEFRFYVGRNSSWGGNMTFYTDTVNRMTISSAGNVGIGTTSPTQGKLVVSNAGPSVIANRETSVGVNSYWNASDGSVTFFGNESNHPLVFNTNNTERMRITSGGNVGISSSSRISS